MRNIQEIPNRDRPREKLIERGAESLSDRELLAVLLGSGHRSNQVMSIASRLLKVLDASDVKPSVSTLQDIEGIGLAKSCQVLAALEFSDRRVRGGVRIQSPQDVLSLVQYLGGRKQEHLMCIAVNGALEVIETRVVSVGLVNRCQIHPREVFAEPLTCRASGVFLAHNHQARELKPSDEDIAVTRVIRTAGEILGIPLLDHVIFNQYDYFSFKEEGML